MGTWDIKLNELKAKLNDPDTSETQLPNLVDEFVNELTINQFASMTLDMYAAASSDEEVDLSILGEKYNEIVDDATEYLMILLDEGRV